jgi:hypothetical protein
LSGYKAANIPQSLLDSLTTGIGNMRTAGVKAVLRPVYDNSSSGADTTLSWVQTHIGQLAAWIDTNKDAIAFMQAGFIGAWGEWHSSSNGLDSASNKAAIATAVMQNWPAEMFIAFRYRGDLRTWWPTALSTNDYAARSGVTDITNAQCQKWAGYSNDFMLSSTSEGDGSSEFTTPKLSQLRQWAAAQSLWTPAGGESDSSAPNEITSCQLAGDVTMTPQGIMADGPYFHYCYFGGDDTTFNNAWTSGGCYNNSGSYAAGPIDWTGYRLQLDNASVPISIARGAAGTVTVALRNRGWGRMWSKRQLVASLVRQGTGETITGTSTAYLRDLTPQAASSTTHAVNVSVPGGAVTGTYDVYLSVPDVFAGTSGNILHNVRFANADSGAQTWDATNARFKTGLTLQII